MMQPQELTPAQRIAEMLLSHPVLCALLCVMGAMTAPIAAGVRFTFPEPQAQGVTALYVAATDDGLAQVIAGRDGDDDFDELARVQELPAAALPDAVLRLLGVRA